MLGMTDKPAKFVKIFGQAGNAMSAAFTAYADEVRRGLFPGPEHSYDAPAGMDFEVLR
jgi:3-methyl-2-oxobutanoate hydroxymethyltransferase